MGWTRRGKGQLARKEFTMGRYLQNLTSFSDTAGRSQPLSVSLTQRERERESGRDGPAVWETVYQIPCRPQFQCSVSITKHPRKPHQYQHNEKNKADVQDQALHFIDNLIGFLESKRTKSRWVKKLKWIWHCLPGNHKRTSQGFIWEWRMFMEWNHFFWTKGKKKNNPMNP